MKKQAASSVVLVGRPTFPDVALWDGVSASAMWSPWIIFRDGPLYFAASAPDLAT
jgi:hypothetical protein